MDHLNLRWKTGYRDKKKRQPFRCLEVLINDRPLLDILSDYEAQHGLSALGDDYLIERDVAEVSSYGWSKSCNDNTSILLLACNCGSWECSNLSVKSLFVDNAIFWQFSINQTHLAPYAGLAEYWFDVEQYRTTVNRFFADGAC